MTISPARQIRLLPFDEVQLKTEPSYLVKGLIPRVGTTLVWGPPKSWKTFWTFDVMAHVALDRAYRGRKVSGGPVVYCAFEGLDGYGPRIAAVKKRYLPDGGNMPLYLVGARIDFAADHPALINAIRETLADRNPAAVVLDTLNRSLSGSESSDADMAAYIRAADVVKDEFSSSVIIVHHSGHDTSRPRGHSSLTGAVDAQLAVKRHADKMTVEVEWMRDGPEGAREYSLLQQVEVGTDAAGNAITSCVVVAVDGVQDTPRSGLLSSRNKRALEVLDDCLVDGFVSKDVWRTKLSELGVIKQNAGNPRMAFSQIYDGLHQAHQISEHDGIVQRLGLNSNVIAMPTPQLVA